jgi:O-methyltransferase
LTGNFGFLARLEFLQRFASVFISSINPAVIHNIEKYLALKKAHYLTCIEHLEGDYLEFGVFTGSSFSHSIRCSKRMEKIFPSVRDCRFYGFDSFEGFGALPVSDKHPFYVNHNFQTNYDYVNRRVSAVAGNFQYKLIKGFFSDTLKNGPRQHGIKKARLVFIDSDTYSSAREAFIYIGSILQEGTYIILDDYFSYKGSAYRGVARAFSEFKSELGIETRRVFDYGMGGSVFVVSKID